MLYHVELFLFIVNTFKKTKTANFVFLFFMKELKKKDSAV